MQRLLISVIFALFFNLGLEASIVQSSSVAPKDLKLVFNAKEIAQGCKEAKSILKTRLQDISKIDSANVSFLTVVVAFEDGLADLVANTDPINFMKDVSTDEAARNAAAACDTEISQLVLDVFAREDIYAKLKAVKLSAKNLDPVDALLLDEYLKDFQENGLELPKNQRGSYLKKRKRIVKLTNEFKDNLGKWKDHLEVTAAELEGAPEDFLKGLEKTKAGKYKVTLSYPDVFGVLDNVKVEETRKKLQFKFMSRGGAKNVKLLEETIALRDECAKMLGYPSHAAYRLSRKMAKDPKTVFGFLDNVKNRLVAKGKEEMKVLVDLKRKETGDSSVTGLNAWDFRYYDTLLKKQKYSVDQEAIKQYFPLQVVLDGMFDIYETLLNVKFVDVTKDVKPWHKDVRAYQVVDGDSKKTIAYFLMDLFPRANKYTHAAAFTLANGRVLEDGSYRLPVSSIVANFNPPIDGQPSLLLHDQVETLFHEFGHIMHGTLTRAKYSAMAGTNTKWDFVEAPSQMLENWVWEPSTLLKMSGNVKNPKEKLPKEMLEKLIAAQKVDIGIFYLRQLTLAYLDMEYHTQAKVDTTAVYDRLAREINMVPIQKGTVPQASFGHLMGGYDAGYYGYMWSEVFAEDMATRFRKEGWLNPKTGRDYRTWILEPGGSIDPNILLEKFLGRSPKEDAFLEKLGVK